MKNADLIEKAASIVKPRKIKDYLIGDVDSNTFCAEMNAIGSMLTAGEYKIKTIVAVWKNENNDVHVLTPCENCRQLMYQVDKDRTLRLKELLPYYDSFQKIA